MVNILKPWPIEIVDFPIYKMVDLSINSYISLPIYI